MKMTEILKGVKVGMEIETHHNVSLYGGTYCASISKYRVLGIDGDKISIESWQTACGTTYTYGETDSEFAEILLKDTPNRGLKVKERDDEMWRQNHSLPDTIYLDGELVEGGINV